MNRYTIIFEKHVIEYAERLVVYFLASVNRMGYTLVLAVLYAANGQEFND